FGSAVVGAVRIGGAAGVVRVAAWSGSSSVCSADGAVAVAAAGPVVEAIDRKPRTPRAVALTRARRPSVVDRITREVRRTGPLLIMRPVKENACCRPVSDFRYVGDMRRRLA